MEKKRKVIKLGGKSVATPALLEQAKNFVLKEYSAGYEILVVISAIGNFTNQTTSIIKAFSKPSEEWDYILSMGERSAAPIFSLILKNSGVKSRFFDPSMQDWFVITDENAGDAKPIMEECERLSKKHLEPYLKTGIPVIPGYVGKSKSGRIRVMGRNSSDLTAMVVAKFLNADEVLKITDVPCLYNPSTKAPIKEIAADELMKIFDTRHEGYDKPDYPIFPQALELINGMVVKVGTCESIQNNSATVINGGNK